MKYLLIPSMVLYFVVTSVVGLMSAVISAIGLLALFILSAIAALVFDTYAKFSNDSC